MITKEQALEAVDILDRLVGLKPVGFSNARKILRQFIEQQPDSKPSAQVPDNVREFVDSWASETCGLKEFDAGVAFACREIKAMLNQSQRG